MLSSEQQSSTDKLTFREIADQLTSVYVYYLRLAVASFPFFFFSFPFFVVLHSRMRAAGVRSRGMKERRVKLSRVTAARQRRRDRACLNRLYGFSLPVETHRSKARTRGTGGVSSIEDGKHSHVTARHRELDSRSNFSGKRAPASSTIAVATAFESRFPLNPFPFAVSSALSNR